MRKIKYPLIISDFDGTLVREDGCIDEKTKKAIDEYVKNGGVFAISTGRMPMGILSRARELGLQGAVSSFQGAVIMDIQTEQVLLQGRMEHELAVRISTKMEELGLHIHTYDLIDYYSNCNNETEEFYVRCVGRRCVLQPQMTAFIKQSGLKPYKLIALTNPAQADRVFNELQTAFGNECLVTTSGAGEYVFVEVCNKLYSKGTAAEFLAKHYGVPLESTVGIGDQRNDLPMIRAVGVGVAVGNAHPALKQEAQITLTQTNEQSAVGVFIEEYAYKESKQ